MSTERREWCKCGSFGVDCSGFGVDGNGLNGSEVNGSVVEWKWVQWKCNGSGVMEMEVMLMEVWWSLSGFNGIDENGSRLNAQSGSGLNGSVV